MIQQQKNGLKYYQFAIFSRFSDRLDHGIFSGQKNKKTNYFGRFDINSKTGAFKNRCLINEIFNYQPNCLVSIKQSHGCQIFILKENYNPRPEADAMISNIPERLLLIETADCQPILLFDAVTGSIGAVHSGWRGSVKNIIGKTIKAMSIHLNVNPQNLLAAVGPSLGPCCAEFIHRSQEFPASFKKYFLPNYKVNLWQASVDQLRGAGVRKKNIELSGICTVCNNSEWFSYRAEKDQAGRLGSVIGLKSVTCNA